MRVKIDKKFGWNNIKSNQIVTEKGSQKGNKYCRGSQSININSRKHVTGF
jgi:hypothetical protein